jgi:hypothetical protein
MRNIAKNMFLKKYTHTDPCLVAVVDKKETTSLLFSNYLTAKPKNIQQSRVSCRDKKRIYKIMQSCSRAEILRGKICHTVCECCTAEIIGGKICHIVCEYCPCRAEILRGKISS